MASDDRTAPPRSGGPGPGPGGHGENATEVAIDALYQGPLNAFVDERNRLARDLRGRDREAAERVRTLAKPSLSAWAVNQAYWHARARFDAMVDAGEAVRALQQRVMRGEPAEGLAAASARLHEAVAPVARAAQEALEQDGHSAAPQLMRRVAMTLQAIAAHGRADTVPPAGRLSADVSPPGFELLTALAPARAAAPASRRTAAPAAPNAPAQRAGARPAPGPKATIAATTAETPADEIADEIADELAAGPEQATAAEPASRAAARTHARPAAAAGPGVAATRTGPRGAHRSARPGPQRADSAPHSRQEARARHAARTRVADAQAALVARQRALTAAERAERAAAERLDAAEAALAAARAALDRATMARDRAIHTHDQAQVEADQERAAFGAARDELESAENQVRALARDRGAGGHEPT